MLLVYGLTDVQHCHMAGVHLVTNWINIIKGIRPRVLYRMEPHWRYPACNIWYIVLHEVYGRGSWSSILSWAKVRKHHPDLPQTNVLCKNFWRLRLPSPDDHTLHARPCAFLHDLLALPELLLDVLHTPELWYRWRNFWHTCPDSLSANALVSLPDGARRARDAWVLAEWYLVWWEQGSQ